MLNFLADAPVTLSIGKLLEGASAKETSELLKGNQCGNRGTSCADQLAIAIEQALIKENTAINN